MMSDIIKQLLLQLVLILLNAFFAATEIAVISLNEKKVRAQAEGGEKRAKKLLKIIQEPTQFLSTIQIGITLAGFLGSAFAADNFAEKLTGGLVRLFGASAEHEGAIRTVSVILITLILSYFTLILGELVPKRVAMRHKEKLAGAVCGVITVLSKILKPVIWLLTVSTNGVLRLLGIDPKEKEEAVSEEDIVMMLDAGGDGGTIRSDDIRYIKNVFRLEHQAAVDIMTPRGAVVAVPIDTDRKSLTELIAREGYSRIPVYEEDLDRVVGILHASEYLLRRDEEGFDLRSILHEPQFVPETMPSDALFREMQREHNHMAVVVNEFGMTLGIVTMEDVLEELVGEIWDEQDVAVEDDSIRKTGENRYTVRTSLPLDDLFEFFSLGKDDEFESSTVNGWLSELCGHIPQVGESAQYRNLTVRVTAGDDLMTREAEVTVKNEPQIPAEAGTETKTD
ncbi:MAG TPA: HlyC/CorC family transporter [Clostridiales bacterium]|nr:HlyC/CorC family transporter [Clostridiales bacterium]